MHFLRKKLEASPALARLAPYVVLLILTFIQEAFAGPPRFWLYLVKMLVGLACINAVRPLVAEMRWAVSWEAVVVGVLVCALWVGLDPWYPKLGSVAKASPAWNPFYQFGAGSVMGWFFVAVRTFGSALVVPPIEETCYRSLLYRYVARADFMSVALNKLDWRALFVTALIFGLAHQQWLAGILCGLAYQWLVLRKGRLGDAMLAHAITNFLLGVWIVWKGAWQFW
jgi:CAAX prenyl protease-like protein